VLDDDRIALAHRERAVDVGEAEQLGLGAVERVARVRGEVGAPAEPGGALEASVGERAVELRAVGVGLAGRRAAELRRRDPAERGRKRAEPWRFSF
jgi:hypothetical protein